MRAVPALFALSVLAPLGRTQVFLNSPGNLPANPVFTDTGQIDVADIDLDGDLDALLADGGDVGNKQNRIWVNLGGLQAGVPGFFVDETSTRAPVLIDQTRDVEFVDFDADGDPDALIVEASDTFNAAAHFWTNRGGLQGSAAGYFVDETSTRWIGLGGPGSSVAPTQVLATGGYINFGHDNDFADLDADGDLDLVLSSMGGGWGGQQPTRLFLNDGLGYFSEFNPSGFQVPGQNILNGQPALWAEGVQQANTLDVGGQFADIAMTAAETSIADVDGDLDLDLVFVDVYLSARLFLNRQAETGTLGFRDRTGAAWPGGFGFSNFKFDAEFGDLNGDFEVDLYGLNWGLPQWYDFLLRGVGDGTFDTPLLLPNTQPDDDGVEFVDYDADGDLDAFLATWSGNDKLFANVGGSGAIAFAEVLDPVAGLPTAVISREAETADLDLDGDFDLFIAVKNAPNRLFLNVLDLPDTTAPVMARLEQPADHASGAATRVRTHAFDNVPELELRRNDTRLEYSVDAGPFTDSPMAFSGGQVFRGELPASAVGNVRYRVRSTDPQGNVGLSKVKSIDTAGGCSGQVATYCLGKLNTDGCVPTIDFEGAPKVAATAPFTIRGLDVLAGMTGLLFYSKTGPGNAPFNGGTICVGPGLLRTPGQVSSGAGACGGVYTFDFNAWIAAGSDTALVGGQKVWAQYWYRDVLSVGGSGLTDGVTFTICP